MSEADLVQRAAALYRDTLVWDMVFPLEPWCGNGYDKLARYQAAGFDLVSITLAGDNHNISEGIQRVAAARAYVLARPDRYRRLFSDAHAEEVRYFRTHGFYPIMHLVVLKRDLTGRFPELPRELQRMFDEAKKLAYDYYADSNYSLLVDARMLYEQQQREFGADPWPNGFKSNRRNLERFIGYSHDQRLIASPFPAERLFHQSTHDT